MMVRFIVILASLSIIGSMVLAMNETYRENAVKASEKIESLEEDFSE